VDSLVEIGVSRTPVLAENLLGFSEHVIAQFQGQDLRHDQSSINQVRGGYHLGYIPSSPWIEETSATSPTRLPISFFAPNRVEGGLECVVEADDDGLDDFIQGCPRLLFGEIFPDVQGWGDADDGAALGEG